MMQCEYKPANHRNCTLPPHAQHLKKLNCEEQQIVWLTSVFLTSLSALFSFYVMVLYLRRKFLRQPVDSTSTLVFFLLVFTMINALARVFGRFLMPHHGACSAQGSIMFVSGLAAGFWSMCMTFHLYRWIVCRDNEAKLKSRIWIYLVIALSVPVSLMVYHLASPNSKGFTDGFFYCWLDRNYRFYHFFLIYYCCAGVATLLLLRIYCHLRRCARSNESQEVDQSVAIIQRRLLLYGIVFVVEQIPSILFRVLELYEVFSYPVALVMQIFLASYGLVCCAVFTGIFSCPSKFDDKSDPGEPDLELRGCSSSTISSSCIRQHSRGVSIFISTFNMGESLTPGALDKWIPLGYEIYVIGVQECMDLETLRSEIRRHISQKQQYEVFGHEIGNRTTALGYHGHIALTIFVRAQEVQHGFFHAAAPTSAYQELNRGKSLGVTRASNKGAVGFAFRYYDTSFAFVTCHLASDSKGKSQVQKRNNDAFQILQELHLSEDDHEFSFPVLHHHCWILGDLNYRLSHAGAKPREILELVAEARTTQKLVKPKVKSEGFLGVNWRFISSNKNNNRDPLDVYGTLLSPLSKDTVGDSRCSALESGQDSRASESSASNGLWSNLLAQHDELTHHMGSHEAFYGFQEGEIAFVPTYRRQREKKLVHDKSMSAEELEEFFSTSVAGDGDRVPSYTDRILFSSLPGIAHRLRCKSYSACESMILSDHRPVCAEFQVLVDTRAKPVIAPPPCLVTAREVEVDVNAMVHLRLRYVETEWLADAPQEEPTALCCMFPLPSEDPLVEQRKLHEVANRMCSSVDESIRRHTNFHMVQWKQFIQNGIKQMTVTRRTQMLHAAVQLRSGTKCLGQGVFCLGRIKKKNRQREMEVECPISVGGVLRGRLVLKLSLRVS